MGQRCARPSRRRSLLRRPGPSIHVPRSAWAVLRHQHSVTLRAMLAREIMIPEPFVAAAGATSAELALLMRAKDISVVPLVDNPKDRRYLGTISDRHLGTGWGAGGHDPKTR